MSLLELKSVSREFPSGEGRSVAALRDVNLTIKSGEWIAIMGVSGSGKSTLMNILGCLDRPTAGSYSVAERDVSHLSADELAQLRREHFGFIFQSYNLLGTLSALENVELPAVYAGEDHRSRISRATDLLRRLGLRDRIRHNPTQLSGGQQQRVTIARAMMNGGEVILADEPTGALDAQSSDEVLAVLRDLHFEGRTIILVTHDAKVAAHAERIVELKDGAVLADRTLSKSPLNARISFRRDLGQGDQLDVRIAALEALCSALLAIRAHRMRSFLTMLGIIIGIASVAIVVALGIGGREKILENIRALGTNTLDIYPGHGWGDERAASIKTLNANDALALTQQPYVEAVTPLISTTATIRSGGISISGTVHGVGDQYFRVYPFEILRGTTLTSEDVRDLSQVVVIDDNARQRLFRNDQNLIGRVIYLGTMPARVIGVARPFGVTSGGGSNMNFWVPYTSVIGRLMGPTSLRSITIRVREDWSMEQASVAVTDLLARRHGAQDFFSIMTDTSRRSVESATATMALLMSSIAAISLIVGGIGVMNIMLVSVTERTREIGIRMAVGARQRDIRQQFLLEATMVCVIGGALGVALALIIGGVVSHTSSQIPMVFSWDSIVTALIISTLIGISFGYLPAHHAASLDPARALARE